MEINGPQRLTSLAVVAAVMVTGRYCAESASIRPYRYRARVARKQYPRWTLFVSAALRPPGLQHPANHPAPANRNSEEKTAPGTMMVMMAIMMAAPRIMSLPIGAESLSGATTFAPPPVKLRQISRPTAQGRGWAALRAAQLRRQAALLHRALVRGRPAADRQDATRWQQRKTRRLCRWRLPRSEEAARAYYPHQ